MTAGTLVDRLIDAHLDQAEAHRKQALCGAVVERFRQLAGAAPASAWWVPGRLEVFGKHTDYAGGHSLVGTVPRGFIVAARMRQDPVVRLYDAARHQEFVVSSAGSRRAESASPASPPSDTRSGPTGWRRYAGVVVERLVRNFPGASPGADIVFASDLPPASGTSSSSALVVGIAAALVDAGRIRDRPEWRANIRSAPDEAGYYACFENGLSFGTLAGDAGVGTHGGSEDHVAIVCGAPHRLSAWRFVPIRRAADLAIPASWRFVIAASGVPAQKTGAAQAAYNSLSQRVSTLLDLWNQAERPERSLHAALASAPGAGARMRHLLASSDLPPLAIAALTARLDHLIAEDRRVLEAVAAFRDADAARVGELSDASQRDAEALLGNQVPETTALASSARQLGAFAASAFGAGFGGSVWALVLEDRVQPFVEAWMAAYRERFPSRQAATAFAAPPGPPLTRLV
jgi:galactokinase